MGADFLWVIQMDFDQCCDYLANKPEATLEFPFDPEVYVYKVCNKIFAIISPSGNLSPQKSAQMNLKCDPHHAVAVRDVFSAIKPGWHMNKKHWNTLVLDNTLPAGEIQRLMDHSYSLIISKLSKAQQNQLCLKYPPEQLYQGLLPDWHFKHYPIALMGSKIAPSIYL